jgi:hypothetical protein
MAGGAGGVGGGERVLHPQLAQHLHGRQVGEAVGAKALHAPAFMVHADQQVGPRLLDLRRQLGELAPVFKVARKQDQPAGERVLQALAVGLGERGAGHVEHHGGVRFMVLPAADG